MKLVVFRGFLLATLVMLLFSACPAPVPPTPTPTPTPTLPPPAGGSTSGLVLKLNPQQLAAQSSDIIVGRITETRSEWNSDHTHIHTPFTLSIEQRVKGSAGGNTVVIDVPGGTVGTVTEAVEDSPGFTIGERVLVFLKAQGNTFNVVGGFQGKRVIDTNGYIAGTRISLDEYIRQIKGEPAQGTGEARR